MMIWWVCLGLFCLVAFLFKRKNQRLSASENAGKDKLFQQFREAADKRMESQRQEKPFVNIDLGSVKVSIKPHELELIAMIMSFVENHGKMEMQEAIKYSILTFALSKNGNEVDKANAEITIQNSVKWEMEFAKKVGFAEMMGFKMECHHQLVEYFKSR